MIWPNRLFKQRARLRDLCWQPTLVPSLYSRNVWLVQTKWVFGITGWKLPYVTSESYVVRSLRSSAATPNFHVKGFFGFVPFKFTLSWITVNIPLICTVLTWQTVKRMPGNCSFSWPACTEWWKENKLASVLTAGQKESLSTRCRSAQRKQSGTSTKQFSSRILLGLFLIIYWILWSVSYSTRELLPVVPVYKTGFFSETEV